VAGKKRRGAFASGAEAGSAWGIVAAGTFLVAGPLLLLFLIFQRRWFDGEETAISGHKNSFRWAVTETIAKVARPGRASGTSTWRISAGIMAPSSIAASS
jgi:hypothetical protein